MYRTLATFVVLVLALAACGPSFVESRPPGTATLSVEGVWSECRSFGGCAYSIHLTALDGIHDAELNVVDQGNALGVGPGLPAELPEGDYVLSALSMLMSDDIGPGGQTGHENAHCSAGFAVGPERAVFEVRATFKGDRCTIAIAEARLD